MLFWLSFWWATISYCLERKLILKSFFCDSYSSRSNSLGDLAAVDRELAAKGFMALSYPLILQMLSLLFRRSSIYMLSIRGFKRGKSSTFVEILS